MQHTTAILVFARSAAGEQLRKKLDKPGKLAIHNFLLKQTLTTVEATGIPYYLVDETLQKGDTFSTRLNNAFQEVFNLGYAHVIAVGSDCPQRGSQDLLLSRQLVERNNICLGPDTHGGVHLLGLSKQIFEAGILNGISWNTARVFKQLTRFLKKENIQHQPISVYADINSSADLLTILNNRFTEKSLQQILQQLLSYFIKQRSFVQPFYQPSFLSTSDLLRGPPTMLPSFL